MPISLKKSSLLLTSILELVHHFRIWISNHSTQKIAYNLNNLFAFSFYSQGASSSGSRGSGSGPGITQDQLNAALAIALGESLRGTPPPASRPEPNIIRTPQPRPIQEIQGAQQLNVQQRANFESQLATMRELGITDMNMATRALQMMGGDVQAAIDLIYSGWNGEGDSANWVNRKYFRTKRKKNTILNSRKIKECPFL